MRRSFSLSLKVCRLLALAFFLGLAAPAAHADSVIKTIGVGAPPTSIAVSPDGQEFWVTFWDTRSQTVDVFATADHSSATPYTTIHNVPIDQNNASAVAFAPDGRFAYIAGDTGGKNMVTSVAAVPMTLYSLPVPKYTVLNRTDAGGNMGTVGYSTSVHLLDLGWGGIAVTSDGFVYAANEGSDTVSALTTGVALPMGSPIAVGGGGVPRGVAATPDGRYVFVTNYGWPLTAGSTYYSDKVRKIATASSLNDAAIRNKEVGIFAVGNKPWGIAITPDGRYAYVANSLSNNVSVVNTDTLASVATINVGDGPTGIAISPPDGRYAYVVNCDQCYPINSGQGTMSVIATASNTVVNTIAVGVNPVAVAISPNGRYAYVTNYGNYTSFGVTLENATIQVIALDFQAAITATDVPAIAMVNDPYTLAGGNPVSFTVTGNPKPTFTVTAGALPPGLSLDEWVISGIHTGIYRLTGTPTTAGIYSFTVTASNNPHGDPNAATTSLDFTIKVGPMVPRFVTADLPDGTVGTPYTSAIEVTGVPTPSISLFMSGSLPPGLDLDSSGTLTGKPTASGTYQFVVEAKNSQGTARTTFEIVVHALNAQTPTITMQPQGTTYNQNDAVAPLSVVASISDGALSSLSYQWFSNTTSDTTTGTEIAGETNSSYTPSTATVGTTYYYVVVTNTNTDATGAKTASATSDSAEITVLALWNAQTPAITVQPQGTTYNQNDAATPLSVTAGVGAGTLSYQWFSNTTSDSTTGAEIVGETNPSYTPSTATVGTTYCYVVVTNTNTNATGVKTASVTSNSAEITVKALLAFTAAPAFNIPASTVNTPIADIDVSGGVSGGTPPYTFTATGLPAGIDISPAGIIFGAPTTAGAAGTAVVTVTDSAVPSASQNITITYGAIKGGATRGNSSVTPVPALSEAALLLLTLLLAGVATTVATLRRENAQVLMRDVRQV